MATNYRTGKFGSIDLAGTNLKIVGWTFDDEVDIEEILDTGGNGFAQKVIGFRRAGGEITMMYRQDQTPSIATPTISPGTRAAATLFIDKNAGSPTIVIPEIVIVTNPIISAASTGTTASFTYEVDLNWTELDTGAATNLTF